MGIGIATAYLSIIVLIPLALVVSKSTEGGWDTFWNAISSPQATSTLKLTVTVSLIVVAVNIVMGTVIAWVLVRDEFRGKAVVNSLIDLPFALPTIVAGLTLLALYGPKSPFGINAAYTKAGLVMALLFVTLPFVVRAVQPVLMELDQDMEEAPSRSARRSSPPSGASSCRTCARQSSPERGSRSRVPWASSGRSS